MDKNFENVKVGDQVVVHTYGWNGGDTLSKVSSLTPKFFIVDGWKYRKKDGKGYGTDSYCYIPDDEQVNQMIKSKEIERKRTFIVNMCSKWFVVSKLTEEQLDSIYETLKNKGL